MQCSLQLIHEHISSQLLVVINCVNIDSSNLVVCHHKDTIIVYMGGTLVSHSPATPRLVYKQAQAANIHTARPAPPLRKAVPCLAPLASCRIPAARGACRPAAVCMQPCGWSPSQHSSCTSEQQAHHDGVILSGKLYSEQLMRPHNHEDQAVAEHCSAVMAYVVAAGCPGHKLRRPCLANTEVCTAAEATSCG